MPLPPFKDLLDIADEYGIDPWSAEGRKQLERLLAKQVDPLPPADLPAPSPTPDSAPAEKPAASSKRKSRK